MTYPPLAQRYIDAVDGEAHALAVALLAEADNILRPWLERALDRPPTAAGGWYEIGTVPPAEVQRAIRLLRAD